MERDMGIKTNLVVSIDEDVVSGDTSVINFKTTNAGNIIAECSVPKVAVKLEDLEEAVKELRAFFTDQKHINAQANEIKDVQVVDPNQISFEYNPEE